MLQGLAVDGSLPSESRLIAASAVVPLQDPPGSELFDFLAGFVRADLDVALRTRAAGALAAAPLSREQRIAVTRLFRTAGLPEAPSLLSVFRNQHDPAIGRALVAELQTSAALDGIHPGDLREVLAGFPDSVRTAAGPLLTRLRDDFESRQTLLAELEQSLPPGDVRRGQAVFLSARAGCYSCHEIGYLGGTIGPDLTHVGKVRTRRDLLEAIVLPSASLVRSYEPSTVVTTAGQTVSGLVRYDSSGVLTVVIDPTRTVTLESSEVEEISPSRVSIMPRGIDKMLSRQELADLVEFLATRK